jgi:hypothetical protein
MSQRRLLILSDLHLGRDCKAITGVRFGTRPDPQFDSAFVDLLDHYTAVEPERWRLVLAGDFIDFVEVVVVPDESGPGSVTFELSKEERRYGLGTEAERAVVKLDMTFDYHRRFFEALGRFVRRGGEVVVLRGNHDAEMHWPRVQKEFRRRLAELAFDGESLDVDRHLEERNAFQSRLLIAPWCYVEPGRVYVEHGHQYDEYCSFDHQLYPVSPSNPHQIDTPLFMFAMRYFVNRMTDFGSHDVQKWGAREYLAYAREKGLGGFAYAAQMAAGAAMRAVWYAGQLAYGRAAGYSREHTRALAEQAQRFGVDEERLREVDALKHEPVTHNLPELLRLLYLDRVVLGLSAVLGALLVLLSFTHVWLELGGLVVVATVAYRFNKWLEPRRFLVPGPKQAHAASRIARLLDVPLVVMGHSHVRRLTDLGEGRWYVNTGCWLPPPSDRDHVDPDHPCSCKLSHLVVEGTEPSLRVFCKAARTVRAADVGVGSHDAEATMDELDATITLAP